MGESKCVQEFSFLEEDKQRLDLEEKIKEMWKIIDDLKKKVAEERELLKKEKNENERMKAEQVKLRKKLSMFHLPHCPAFNAPPCPVHPFKSQDFSVPDDSVHNYKMDKDDLFQGDHDMLTYEKLVQRLRPQVEFENDDLFSDCSPRPSSASFPELREQHSTNFTLLLSDHWKSRLPHTNTDEHILEKQTKLASNQSTDGDSLFRFNSPQLSTPSQMFSGMQ